MQAPQVQSLGQEDPVEKGMAPHSCLENFMDRGAWWATVHGVAKSQLSNWATNTAEQLTHAHTHSWLTMLWQFQMNSKELSHRYICSQSPPSPPPIQNGILHWVEFMSCACSVVLVIHFDHGRVYMTFPNPLFFFFKLFIQLRLLLCEGFL